VVAVSLKNAKVWFVVLHRRQPRFEGWAVQGFLAGFAVVAVSLLLASGTAVGAYLDTAAPGLFTGLAIGRVGCFFAGCCSGRPTTSRVGLWSSDQRVGTRRVPTQLLESALAATVALGAGLSVGVGGASSGWVFVAAVGAYTALRQAILGLRVERRQSTVGPRVVAAVAAVVFIVSVVASFS
jgi:phosphatidylglycerol:prolipoprotein diacylglycerol transferase